MTVIEEADLFLQTMDEVHTWAIDKLDAASDVRKAHLRTALADLYGQLLFFITTTEHQLYDLQKQNG